MVIDTQATPIMAQDVIRHIRTVTDKADQVRRAVALPCRACWAPVAIRPEGAEHIIASQDTYDLIVEREAGQSERDRRFPASFRRSSRCRRA